MSTEKPGHRNAEAWKRLHREEGGTRMSSTIFEVLSYGPIVAGDEDMGYLVTINGSCLNLWSSVVVHRRDWDKASQPCWTEWNNIDCRATNLPNGLYACTAADAWEMGKAWLAEILADIEP